MVIPYFHYCSVTWSTADQNHIDVLERVQKRAGRMSQVELVREKCRGYDKLKWTNLQSRLKINRCVMLHKCLNGMFQNTLETLSPEVIIGIALGRLHRGSVNIPAIRTVQGQRSFRY